MKSLASLSATGGTKFPVVAYASVVGYLGRARGYCRRATVPCYILVCSNRLTYVFAVKFSSKFGPEVPHFGDAGKN